MFSPIKQRKISEIVAEQILNIINNGELKPGDRLPGERKIAEELQVSRPPVRDAIKELIFKGFLETKGNATYIKAITESLVPNPLKERVEGSEKAYQELAEIRELLEGWAAGKAAECRSEAQLKHLEQIVQDMEDPSKRKRITPLDLDFHRTVAEMVGNTIYLHQITSIAQIMIPIVTQYRENFLVSEDDWELLLQHHRNVYEGIRDQDPARARAAMEEHIQYTKQVKPQGITEA